MNNSVLNDVNDAKALFADIPRGWEGKQSILEMKAENFQWRQMEWWAFYFELLCRRLLSPHFTFPGARYGNIVFDMKGSVNWDLKAKAIRSDDHRAILNDCLAIHKSIEQFGSHGVIIALCDVEYNDINRTFQQWIAELKGKKSAYEIERERRTSTSRYRKTRAELAEIVFLEINASNAVYLDEFRQGRNSNGSPRAVKYMVDLEKIEPFLVDRLSFSDPAE